MADETTKATWTVMVYLAGDNNLTDESVYAMTEMRKVGSGDGVNIITQFDPKDDYLPTHRYHIGKNGRRRRNGEPTPLPDDIIDEVQSDSSFKDESALAREHARVRREARKAAEKAVEAATHAAVKPSPRGIGQSGVRRIKTSLLDVLTASETGARETDTGSPVTLYNFMSMCIQTFPADHYMVVLSGHGSGTSKDFFLRDDSPGGSLTIRELKEAFTELKPELDQQGRTIDILGMDVCLMSMAEVAYELRGLVRVMVGSESYSPASGWPYEPILKRLKESVREPTQFARSIVEEYVRFYADYWLGGLSVDQSALDVTKVEKLKTLIDKFAAALIGEMSREVKEEERARKLPENEGRPPEVRQFRDNLVLAHWEAQSYNGEQFIDIYDFCDCLLRRHQSGPVAQRGRELQAFIKDTFVLKSCYSGPVNQYSHGVSLYFPWATVTPDYGNLDFAGGPPRSDEAYRGRRRNLRTRDWEGFLRYYTAKTRREPRRVEQTGAAAADTVRAARCLREFIRAEGQNSSVMFPERFRISQGKGPEGNPIRSMRNPPVTALPNECITEEQSTSILKGQRKLFKAKI